MKTCFVGHSWNQPRKKPLRGFVFIYPFSPHHPLDRFYIQMQNISAFVLRIQSDFGLIYRTILRNPTFCQILFSDSCTQYTENSKPPRFSKSLVMIVQLTVISIGPWETTKLWPNRLLTGLLSLFSTEHISQTCKMFFLQDVSEVCAPQAAPAYTRATQGSVVTKLLLSGLTITQSYVPGRPS